MLYVLLAQRGLRVGLTARDPFGKLLAVGLAGALLLQVFVVAGGVTGLIPLTGKALPFLAKGGSSLVANWVMVALLLRISDHAQRRREPGMSPALVAAPQWVDVRRGSPAARCAGRSPSAADVLCAPDLWLSRVGVGCTPLLPHCRGRGRYPQRRAGVAARGCPVRFRTSGLRPAARPLSSAGWENTGGCP